MNPSQSRGIDQIWANSKHLNQARWRWENKMIFLSNAGSIFWSRICYKKLLDHLSFFQHWHFSKSFLFHVGITKRQKLLPFYQREIRVSERSGAHRGVTATWAVIFVSAWSSDHHHIVLPSKDQHWGGKNTAGPTQVSAATPHTWETITTASLSFINRLRHKN